MPKFGSGQPQPANAGRPKGITTRDIPGYNALKTLSRHELVAVGNVLIKGDMDGLRALERDPKAPALLAVIASVILKAHERGDMHTLDVFLNRIIGKVKDESPHGGSLGSNTNGTVLVTLPSNGREVRPK